jgi:hypothetical protein
VINEVLAFRVFPLLGMNRERFFAQRIWVTLA